MDNFEKAEKIREKCGVSFEEAKDALERSNYDLLDAIVYLEQSGRINRPDNVVYVSEKDRSKEKEFEDAQKQYKKQSKKRICDYIKDFWAWLSKLFKKSCETSFVVEKNHKEVIAVPVLVFILLVIFAFWITVPLLIIGLFFECRYHFEGIGTVKVDVNKFCEKASEGAEEIKNQFRD